MAEENKTQQNIPAKPAPTSQGQNRSQGGGGFQGGQRQGQGGYGGGDRRKNTFRGRPRRQREKPEYDTRLLDLARVTRVTRGGKRFSFRATVAIGDGKGMVGVGVAQGKDVQQAMQKAGAKAKKVSIKVPIVKTSIPHEVIQDYHGARVMLKPAPIGNGVKAGGPVRIVAKLAGLENVTAKLIKRTHNKLNIARATMLALQQLEVRVPRTSATKITDSEVDPK